MSAHNREYGQRLLAIHRRIAQRLGAVPLVFHSAYETDELGLPVDNLDEVAVEAAVRFCVPCHSPSGKGKSLCSEGCYSPTWMEVALLADDIIRRAGDRHRRFLTGIRIVVETDGIKTAQLQLGSWCGVGRQQAAGYRQLLRAVS